MPESKKAPAVPPPSPMEESAQIVRMLDEGGGFGVPRDAPQDGDLRDDEVVETAGA